MHFPQVPFPPHGASMDTSADRAHSIKLEPATATIVFPDG
jgi:hypothetical protein